ncbi:hypothetical protein QTJ16_002303 [Diplocarpon rosae]|uniref:Carrier domain-containing protein n=1 Tax=Diplocarpon rosae TaxID=946125 RepID=A0AAD9T218_9HELO|nr:hypothetical protein QTJ16_002303 [Diplocarpon rosae]
MTQRLSILNDPPAVLRGPELLHELIPWEKHSSSCAVDFSSRGTRKQYSYRDLQTCVSAVQSRIQQSLRVEPNSSQHIVPVLLPQSPGLYISLLAILQSGGAFCPLNLDAPQDRIKVVVGDVCASLIITTPELQHVVSWESGPTLILVQDFPDVVPRQGERRAQGLARDAIPADVAYVMYTSGSSGRPKGVAVSHSAVTQSLLAHERHIPPFDRFLQFAAPSFDVSLFEIFFPLVRGATLVGCNRTQLLNDLPGTITELEVDAAELTPTVVGSLLQKRSNAPGLKLLLTIGEMLTRPIVEEFGGSETQPHMLYGMYGPTEAAIHCTISPRMAIDTNPGNIGIPFDTVSTFIAAASTSAEDAASLSFVPVGELGELVLGGPQLARGYTNREEENKAAFVHFEGKRYYRTGDQARQREDGTIEILGRLSAGQVKLRGQRVELGEIEEVIYRCRGVQTVVAMVLKSVLIVFALVADQMTTAQDVLETCNTWLPKFMVPSEIVLLQNFPYLPSGKVDKRRLEADYQSARASSENESMTSATETELGVRRVLQELLGTFSTAMRLPAAGIDSLVAIRVASKLRGAGFNVDTISVLQAETFRSLVDLCDTVKHTPPIQERRKVASGEHVGSVLNGHAQDVEFTTRCTPVQSAMLSETAIDAKAYRNWVELELPGITGNERIISALSDLANVNSILRTGFAETPDQNAYVQVIWRSLEDSQIELVDAFNYSFDESKDISIRRPIRFQIRHKDAGTKILVHIHHALYDAWSLELLLDDLDTILRGEPLLVRPPFTDVVESYQDGTLTTGDWTSRDYWKDHLALLDIAPLPNFHTGKTPPASLAVERLQTTIATSDIEATARRLSASPQSLFQAAYVLVLSSYIGSSDICFGTVFSGRTLPIAGIEDIAGPCLATLPVRVDLSITTNLHTLVQELNSTNRKHLKYSTLPLRDIKAASGVDPRRRLFDTLLIWQQTLHSYDHAREHVVLVDTVDNLEFSLTIEIIPSSGRIELKANYQQAIVPSSQIRILLQQVEQLARAIIEDETTSLQSAFTHLEKEVLSIGNDMPDTRLRAGTLSSPVEEISAVDPDRLAIEFATSIDEDDIEVVRITYSELNTYSNQIGHHLLEQYHVPPDELVCICMEKSIDMYASILATAKIGAGYLPLTPDIPYERLQHILREAKVKVVIARSLSRSLFQAFESMHVFYIDDVQLPSLSTSNIPPRSSSDMVSYCVFTSGSTGTPKGVLITQGNLLSNLDVLQDLYPTSETSRFLQSCSQAFDVSVFEIFFAWRVGGTICSAVKDVLFQDIENAIRLFRATHLSLTPTVAALIDPDKVPNVEFLVTAGEAVSPKVFNRWAGRGLWQGYGPSETTNICTISPRVSKHDAINNIGPPFRNTSAFVLAPGPDFTLVPRGGVGEFCFGGAQVFRGYIDLSQQVDRIVEHPRLGRLYRSGDFGRLMPDGSLAFLGRKDDQVKIRGQRVELGEINNIMLRSEDVADSVAMIIDTEKDCSQRLVCFWASGQSDSEVLEPRLLPDREVFEKLYRSLDAALPAYMIPTTLIPVSFMPSTPQGKIDKRLLVKHFQTLDIDILKSCSRATTSASDHTWTDLETAIAQAVAEITRVSVTEIGPDTSFFGLGIDSITAIWLSKSLVSATGKRINISDILKFSSVTRLAEKLSTVIEDSRLNIRVASEDGHFGFDETLLSTVSEQFETSGKRVQDVLPCTPLQEAILSAVEASQKKLYDNSVIIDITGDVVKLEKCWQEMARRHEIMRTCFVSTDSQRYPFVQVVLKDYDLSFGSIASLGERASPGDFAPPYTLDLIKLPGAIKLVISMHHALYDGVALATLCEEVEKLYHGRSLASPVSFAPFLKSMVSLDMEKADQFWHCRLRNCPFPKFRDTTASSAPQVSENQRIQRISAKSPLSWLESSIKKYSTSLLAVCHTAWVSVLSEYLQETDICFGNVVSGRSIPVEGIERLVAPCFNTIPARLQNVHQLSYLEAFRRLQSFHADSIPFQLMPLRRIQTKLSPDGSRLFDTLFILQQPSQDLDAEIWRLEDDSGSMDLPIVCEVMPRHGDDTLVIILHSYTDMISEVDALRLLEAFDAKLLDALENPRRQMLSQVVKERINKKMESREMSRAEVSRAETSAKAMSAAELRLRDVISNFTDVPSDKIGRDMSIFRLGLDSISSVQVATRLRKQGHKVLASDILENSTIARLNSFLSISATTNNTDHSLEYDFATFDELHRDLVCSKLGVPRNEIEAVMPCTSVQQGMLAQTLHSGGLEYVNSMWYEIPAEVSILDIKNAWKAACANNEMLRASFASTENTKQPFVLVVRVKNKIQLPWSEEANAPASQLSSTDELLMRPWSLSLSQQDGLKILRFTAHHALYDARSIQMLLSDVAKAYTSQSPAVRPPVASLLGAMLHDSLQNIDEKRTFWEREENKIVVNRFPDLTPLQLSDTSSAVREITSQSSSSQLEALCRISGVTIQAAGQATWARVLAFYVGETSTTFGTILSGRSVHEDADQIAFPSIVTLPVRCDITGTNEELLSRTMISNAAIRKHQFAPLTSIQRWAGYPEGRIFDTLFAFQKLPEGREAIQMPWKVVKEEVSADYAVSLEVQPTARDSITLRLTFRQDLIPAEHALLLLKQYDFLLLDTLRNPKGFCDVAPCASDQLLSITAAKEDILPAPVTLLHQFVELGAREFPDRRALEFATNLDPQDFKSTSWTYKQLDEEANKIACMLLKHHVEPGKMIAICFDKCAEASFTIIGILKAGCSYVALDPNAPADRLKFIVEDSGAKLVVAAGKPGQDLKEILRNTELILLDSPGVFGECTSEQPKLSRDVIPEDVAYCLYTSGTTGTPKGCLITHDNTVQFMLAFSRLFAGHWESSSKYLQFASFHFDVSVMEQFWSWSVGMCVASAPRDLIFEDLTGAIQLLGITHIDLTPSLARLIHPTDVPTLLKGGFVTGGEQLTQEILDVWGEHAVVYNAYGPTEATIGCTMYPRVPQNGKPSNIGPAYVNAGSFVLKPGTEDPVVRGGVGELCVSGKLVGKGYLNRPDLTAERFPTLQSFNERVYRTGDLVRILHDGSFIFLGRADDQVKLRGQRLELSEINEVIKKGVAALQDVVTLVLRHRTQQKEQLVTFFVAADSTSGHEALLIGTIRDSCKSCLPGYMVPTHFIPISALPLNANNKADTRQLAAMYNELTLEDMQQLSHAGQDDYEWSENETRVLEAVAQIMQVDALSLTGSSTIFELGIDSISIIGFARALQSAGWGSAKLSIVKNNANMKALVRALIAGDGEDQVRENAYVAAAQSIAAFEQRHLLTICQELDVESQDVERIAPCTPVQEGMIYRFLESESSLYFNTFEFTLDESVDVERLTSAWETVMGRLEVLRMKFAVTDDGFAQVVLRKVDAVLGNCGVDYQALEKFAALKSPYSIAFEGMTFTLQMFHGLYDGNSLKMLLRCVIDEYSALEYVDYGPSFMSSLPHGPLATVPGSKDFWASHLQDWVFQPLPSRLESPGDIIATNTYTHTQNLSTLCRILGVTHQALVQAAWLSVLQTLTSSAPTIGIVISGRAIDLPGVEKVIGPLFNTVPCHIAIEPGISSSAFIRKCHEFNLRMQDFQHAPLKDIQRWSPAMAGQRLFESLFVFQREDDEERGYADGMWRQNAGGSVADYPLAFEATLSPDSSQLSLIIVAQSSTLSQQGADELLNLVQKAFTDMLDSSGENIISGTDRESGARTSAEVTAMSPAGAESTRDRLFTWTEDTSIIRSEIASLANISAEAVQESSSVFELGLDSIDVIKLASRLKKRGIEIPVSVIVKSQTIARISRSVTPKKEVPRLDSSNLVLQMSENLTRYLQDNDKLPANIEAVLPATPLQQSMVSQMINSGYTRYFNVDGFRLGRGVDVEGLREAVRRVVRQSPILRTTFVAVEDPKAAVSYAQVIRHPELFVGMSSEISRLEEGQNFEGFMEKFRSESSVLAAENEQLLQVRFVAAGESKYLAIAISHALYDGTSLGRIHGDIQRAYKGELLLRPDPMPFLEEVFHSTTESAKKFWRATLSNLPSAAFPRKPESEILSQKTSTRLEKRSRVSLERITAFCRSSRITFQTLGQTCWALVLSHLTSQLDVVFGSVLSCRDSEEAAEVMFPLMNTVAVRSVIHGSIAEMLRYMQGMSDAMRECQHFPLGTAQAYAFASRPNGDGQRDTVLFDTLFIYQGRQQIREEEKLYESVYGAAEVEFPVCVEMEVVDEEYLSWTAACQAVVRDEAETGGILDALETVLERILDAPESQSIFSSADGVSICGLPAFRHEERLVTQEPRTVALTEIEWTEAELAIRSALHTLSDIPEDLIRKDSTIFQLGLDSIAVLKLPALLKTMGINLTASEIMREQTVYAMARAAPNADPDPYASLDVDGILAGSISGLDLSSELAELEREAGAVQDIMPATAGEKYMIRQWQAAQGGVFYQTFTYTLSGPINRGRLRSAWETLLERHDILRTGFMEVGSEILQVVFKHPPNEVIYQTRDTPPTTRKEKSNLKLPPVNLVVEGAAQQSVTLRLVLHHALYDGISLPILVGELQSLYHGLELDAPTLSFRTFVAQFLAHPSPSSMKGRWRSYLASPSPIFPRNTSVLDTTRTEVYRPSSPIRALEARAQESGVSIDALFLAGLSKLYARSRPPPSARHVTIGVYLANRAPFGADLSSLAAPTLNLLPLCVQDTQGRIEDVARDVQRDLRRIGSREMVGASLEQILAWTGQRIDFCVNILKSASPAPCAAGGSRVEAWTPVQDLGCRRAVVPRVVNTAMRARDEREREGAYLPSVDVELRYHDAEIDIGVFAPGYRLSVAGAEGLIEEFLALWE